MLLKYGARVGVRNEDGKIPMDLMRGKEFRGLLERMGKGGM